MGGRQIFGRSELGLPNKFQENQGYREKSCLKKQEQKQAKTNHSETKKERPITSILITAFRTGNSMSGTQQTDH